MNNKSHDTPRDRRRNRHSQYPPPKNPHRHPPIHSLPIPITQPDGDRRANNTLRSTHWQSQATGQKHRQRTPQFHAEPPAGGVQGQSVAEVFHHVVAPGGEADNDGEAAEGECPDGHGDGRGDGVGLPDEVDCCQWADGVGDVVGAVGEGLRCRGQDLEEGVEVFGLVVVVGGAGVHPLESFCARVT